MHKHSLWLILLAFMVAGCAGQQVVRGPTKTEPGRHFIFPLIFISPQQPKTVAVQPTPLPALRKVAGVAWPGEDGTDRAAGLAQLGAQATLDWGHDPEKAARLQQTGVIYLPMQWSCRGGAKAVNVNAVTLFARRYPGATWLAFNEPDHSGQANCTPAEGAEAYFALYAALMAADPTARVYCCGTAWPAGHIAWTQAFSAAYRARYGTWPPVDGLHIHSYSQVWEARFECRARQTELETVHAWTNIQPWLAGKPLIVSEWGVLSGSWWREDAARMARNYIPTMRAWFDRQTWILADVWFATWYSDTMYQPSNIFERNSSTLTVVGDAWRRAARQ